jgi:hypothetical protein
MDHWRLHTDFREFTCITCGQQFKWKLSLGQSIRNPLGYGRRGPWLNTDFREFTCITCGQQFKWKLFLGQSIRNPLGYGRRGPWLNTDFREFTCTASPAASSSSGSSL